VLEGKAQSATLTSKDEFVEEVAADTTAVEIPAAEQPATDPAPADVAAE
jgi:hypothetical protein